MLYQLSYFRNLVPRTGLEPACLSTHAPETCASTIPPPGPFGLSTSATLLALSGKRDSNSRPQPWQGYALPTELFPQFQPVKEMRLELTRHNCHHPLKVARLPIPPFLQKEKEKNCFRGAQNRTRTCMPLDTRT